MNPKYKRVLLKLSGGALASNEELFSKEALKNITKNIINASEAGIQIAIVVGGGNIFRGRTADEWNIDRVEADNIGMLSTIINSLILKGALASQTDRDIRMMTSLPMNSVAEPYIRLKAKKYLDENSIVIFGGGTGQPFISTDYPSIQRAIEIGAEIVLMAKDGVDGIYTANPQNNKDAKRYKEINSSDVISLNLKVADSSAFILAKEFNMPMYVFNFKEENSIIKACSSESNIGTFVSNECKTMFY